MIRSDALRKSARGQDCTLRLPGVCSYDPSTTVLAHIPCGQRGIGLKGPDTIAVFACHACHDVLDGRRPGVIATRDITRALAETQNYWIERGLLSVRGALEDQAA